jgi:hypothetical protein
MTAPVTADAFADQLRADGCRVQIDRSYTGAVYLRASKFVRSDTVDMVIVFEGGRFKRAFVPWLGVHRRRWPKFRTMKSVRCYLDVRDAA